VRTYQKLTHKKQIKTGIRTTKAFEYGTIKT